MSSLTLKLVSLAVRTAAKPIGNYIKRQAKEHEGFRRFAVGAAQGVHRLDMRMRLGLLHDADAQQRMHEREQRAAEEKKRKAETPTVRTAEDQKKYDEQKAQEAADEASGKKKADEAKPSKPKIRPLTEARAIELGANFFSEAFIFGVAVGLLLFENWRSSRKASARRDEVSERLEQLEAEVESLRAKLDPDLETLHDLSERVKEAKRRRQSWSGWVASGFGLAGSSLENAAIKEGANPETKSQGEENDYTKVKVHGEELIAPTRKAPGAKAKVKDAVQEKAKEDEEKQEKREQKPPQRVDTVQASAKGR